MNSRISDIKNRLRELRKRKGLTQIEVAEHIGMTREAYSKWENHKNEAVPCDRVLIEALADLYGVSCDYILCRSDFTSIEADSIGKHIGLSDDSINLLREYTRQDKYEGEYKKECQALLKSFDFILRHSNIEHAGSFTGSDLIANLIYQYCHVGNIRIQAATKEGKGANIDTSYTFDVSIEKDTGMVYARMHPITLIREQIKAVIIKELDYILEKEGTLDWLEKSQGGDPPPAIYTSTEIF